jgi:hypothetical protein
LNAVSLSLTKGKSNKKPSWKVRVNQPLQDKVGKIDRFGKPGDDTTLASRTKALHGMALALIGKVNAGAFTQAGDDDDIWKAIKVIRDCLPLNSDERNEVTPLLPE